MGQTYAISDLHGRLDLWRQIQDYLKPDDKVIFLGDAVDRGKDGVQLMLELLRDSRVTYLLGNHEVVMQRYYIPNYLDDKAYLRQLWFGNGGKPTYDDMRKLDRVTKRWAITKITNLPKTFYYHSKTLDRVIYLSHSGAEPEDSNEDWFTEDRRNNKYPGARESLMYVHGHTPVQYLAETMRLPYREEKPDSVLLYHRNKISIDTAAYFTGVAALLNLETLTPIYFTSKEEQCQIQ